MAGKAALETLLSKRLNLASANLTIDSQATSSLPAVPSWKREELWHARPTAASAYAEEGHAFTYRFDDARRQLEFVESHDQIGFRVWDGAMIVSKWLEGAVKDGRIDFSGRRIVELGAGTGIVGLVASMLGDDDTKAVLTDMPALIPRMADNISSNGVSARCCAMPLTWANEDHVATVLDDSGGPPDIVIACDMAAAVKYVAPFMESLARLLPSVGRTDKEMSSSTGEKSSMPTPPAQSVAATSDGANNELAEAFLTDFPPIDAGAIIKSPCFLLCAQHHREFTAPLLQACAARYTVRIVPQEQWHPDYRSQRHSIYVITATR